MEKAMSAQEVAAFTGMAVKTIQNLVAKGQIPCYRPRPKLTVFRQEDIEKFMFRNRQAADYELEVRAEALLNGEKP